MSPLAQVIVAAASQLAQELPSMPILVFGSALDVEPSVAVGDVVTEPTSRSVILPYTAPSRVVGSYNER